jgi:serpin B
MEMVILVIFPLLVILSPVSLNPKQILSLSKSIAQSGKDLFDRIDEKEKESANVIISPLSIHLAMSLLYNGAKGASKDQLAKSLWMGNATDAAVLEESKILLTSYSKLKNKVETRIELANVLFVDETFDIKDDYQSMLKQSFLTEVRQVDYSNGKESEDTINDWVANKTNNLIKDLISPGSLDPGTRLMLLNAVYFKANWQLPFEKDFTTKNKFFVSQESVVEVDMMFQENEILYGLNKELQSQVVSLKYEDPNFTMLIFLPNKNIGLDSLRLNLKDNDFSKIHNSLNSEDLLLGMPKFKLGFTNTLVPTFRDLGVFDIFNEASADLSKISNESLAVSNILHEAKIEVNEEGSEAAAVTGIHISTRSGGSGPITLKIDRPFIFVIQDLKNNIPLFIGKIVNPTNQEAASVRKPIYGDISKNSIDTRSALPLHLQETDDLDPEERAHKNNFPENLAVTDCSEDFSDEDKVVFPCPPLDTQPIEDYKRKHGDPSKLGINGENAALLGV